MLRAIDSGLTAGLRELPAVRGKAHLALTWKKARERRGPLDGAWTLQIHDESIVSLPLASTMTWTVACAGEWDRAAIELVSRYVTPDTLVLDVGASLGLWAVPLAKVARARACVMWAIEPNPQNIPWLTENLRRNGLTEVVEVHQCALGSQPGTMHLGYRECGGGNGALLPAGAVAASVSVEVAALDDLPAPKRVGFIKLDVEGFELEVLRGACATIERDRPVIFGEFSAGWLRARNEDLPSQLAALGELGYDLFVMDALRSAPWRRREIARLRRLDPQQSAGEENLLLVPREVSA